MYFVAVDIGCLECGESSHVLGIFTSKQEAEKICNENDELQNEQWTGEHYFEVYPISQLNKEFSPYKKEGESVEEVRN